MIEFYIQNREAGFVGNDIIWYRKDGCGYTTHIKEAHVFTEKEAKDTCERAPEKYVAWLKAHVDEHTCVVVDMQYLDVHQANRYFPKDY